MTRLYGKKGQKAFVMQRRRGFAGRFRREFPEADWSPHKKGETVTDPALGVGYGVMTEAQLPRIKAMTKNDVAFIESPSGNLSVAVKRSNIASRLKTLNELDSGRYAFVSVDRKDGRWAAFDLQTVLRAMSAFPDDVLRGGLAIGRTDKDPTMLLLYNDKRQYAAIQNSRNYDPQKDRERTVPIGTAGAFSTSSP